MDRLLSQLSNRLSLALALCIVFIPAIGNVVVHAAADLPTTVQTNPADFTPNVIGDTKNPIKLSTGEKYDTMAGDTARTVNEILRVGNNIYAAGIITDVVRPSSGPGTWQKITYGNIFRFDATTYRLDDTFKPILLGKTTASDPNAILHPTTDGEVFALAASSDGKYLYVGGAFQTVSGVPATGIFKWDIQANSLDASFNPVLYRTNFLSATVYDIKLHNGLLYVASDATMYGAAKVPGSGSQLMTLDPNTGARVGYMNLAITEPILDPALTTKSSGAVRVEKIAISSQQNRLVMIGNFRKVAGQERLQLAMLSLDVTSASLLSWYPKTYMELTTQNTAGTKPITPSTSTACSPAMPMCMRDVDWNSAGTNFVLCTTGGNRAFPSLSDAASYWNGTGTNSEARPLWINYTGGDTFLSCQATQATAYVGGHFRFLDHSVYANVNGLVPTLGSIVDRKVYAINTRPHAGLGAINLATGVAIPNFNNSSLTSRGFGWAGMYVDATPGSSGLWVGGDTENIYGEPHKRIGFFPV